MVNCQENKTTKLKSEYRVNDDLLEVDRSRARSVQMLHFYSSKICCKMSVLCLVSGLNSAMKRVHVHAKRVHRIPVHKVPVLQDSMVAIVASLEFSLIIDVMQWM